MYKIKKLDWQGKIDKDKWYSSITAETPFGFYEVSIDELGRVSWGYCFDEYFDEEVFYCDSVKDGKREAEEHWLEKIKTALIEVKDE